MAIVTENGTGQSTAETLCSVTDADTYLAARGITLWGTLSTAEREQALRRAADHIEQTFSGRWAGSRLNDTQALSWPRVGVPMRDAGSYYASDSVPVAVRDAQALMAFKAASGDLSPDVERVVQSEAIGPISTTYAAGAPPFTQYRAITAMLAPFMRHGGNAISILRC